MEKENYKKLYASGAHGTRVYEIWSEGHTIVMIANGAKYEETIEEGKAGRSLEEQVQLRINARVRSKMDHGFVENESDIRDSLTNQMGYAMPMLADHLKNQRNFTDEMVYIQPKMDGHRCLTNSRESYSRGGKPIDCIGDLTSRLKTPDGMTFDGELYYHGVPLQTISSWAKRYQPNTEKLEYHIYDIIIEDEMDMPFKQRFDILSQLVKGIPRIVQVPTHLIHTELCHDYFKEFRNSGFEGAIVRTLDSQYQIGKRSKGLLKIKHYEEAEFPVVDIEVNRLGWAILWCEAPNGKLFKATAPGTVHEKMRIAALDKNDFIGRLVTVEYANYTKEGKPFQPVATRWRDDL